VRLDKWLWAARVFKTRSIAATACDAGKVDVNDPSAKPAKALRPGDVVRVTLPQGGRRILKVNALDDGRGSSQGEAGIPGAPGRPPPSGAVASMFPMRSRGVSDG